MSPTRWALALSMIALAAVPRLSRAQNAAPADTASPPPAAPADVASADAIMHAVYDVISGPAGPRDWQRFASLFVPGARLIPTVRPKDSTAPHVAVMTPQEYAQRAGGFFSKEGFYEREIGHTSETFGAITQRFSAYASRHAADDATPFARGINSFQLFNDGKRWYIVTIYWDDERSGEKIPTRYLDK
jgi:hypothetical protein